jgi:hypothetical protein
MSMMPRRSATSRSLVTKRYAASPMTEFLGRRPVDVWLSLISNQNG